MRPCVIGDGLLAIFPVDSAHQATEMGGKALLAAQDAFVELEKLNAKRLARSDAPLAFGVGLHVGNLAYGNIGGAARLDFTAIGPAVNLASRIEGMSGKLGKKILLSEVLAKQLTTPVRLIGAFELKGITAPQNVYEPVAP